MKLCGKNVLNGEVVTLTVAEGRIAGLQPGGDGSAPGGPDVWLAPGFFDIQVNGYAGGDFNGGMWIDKAQAAEAFPNIIDKLAVAGTALFCPTVITASKEAIIERLKAVVAWLDSDARAARAVPGLHLEGPYIASEDGPRGAHPLEDARDPDWDEFCRFQEAAAGRLRLCTLAPEREGALAFIEKLVEAGIVAAIGHTGARPEVIRDAARAGASLSTHLGNGAHQLLPRHPNYIWEQLAQDALTASIIADGHHLPASVVKVIARVKGPERLILVSDAVALGGLAPGLYAEGRYEVLESGRVNLAGTPYLAGAGHLLDTCVPNALRSTDLTLAEVVGCVSAIPARLLGLQTRKGALQTGYDADLTLFRLPEEGPLEIVATVCGGEITYQA
ncbi:MAG TPA: amidohydrolase family protein [Chthonomonadaceae bacterium]|nr:amidohydrolase family protein [Chthonomonadaceae bacterium]